MREDEIKTLQEELELFKREKNEIRNIIGSIGGKNLERQDKFLNIFFILTIVVLFMVDIMRHILKIDIPLPPLFSIEIGLLLVSIKIIWMINKQMKVEHFQFWILNSIEFRINGISKKLSTIEKELSKNHTNEPDGAEQSKRDTDSSG